MVNQVRTSDSPALRVYVHYTGVRFSPRDLFLEFTGNFCDFPGTALITGMATLGVK